jgi:hypothetical protein
VHPGGCACDGHGGPSAQLASLSACAGAHDLPAFLLAPPPAVLASPSVGLVAPRRIGVAATPAPILQPSAERPPLPPPPQA